MMSNQKKLFAGTVVVLVGAFFVGRYFFKDAEIKKIEKKVATNQSSLIRDYSPSIGSTMLRVTLVEFLDPECESCASFHPVVKAILARYEGKIRYVVRYAPFHPNSKFIIRILEAARKQNKYWETLDLLFKKLPEWGSHHQPKPELVWTYLPSLGLDIDKLKNDMNDPEIPKMIAQEIKDGRTFGVNRTPTFFINGRPLKSFGAKQLEATIEAAFKE